MESSVSLVRVGDVESVLDDLVGIYKECWAHKLHLSHYAPETFGERLHRHAAEPDWEAVVAYDSGEPIGYVSANRLSGADDRWWRRTRPEPEPTIEGWTSADGSVSPLGQIQHQGGDVPRIVVASVVAALQGKAGQVGLCGAGPPAPGTPRRRAGPVHVGLRQPGQLRAERAHFRSGRAYQQPVFGEALARAQVDHGEPNLDDLADLAGWWLSLPACRFDIDRVQQVHATTPPAGDGRAEAAGRVDRGGRQEPLLRRGRARCRWTGRCAGFQVTSLQQRSPVAQVRCPVSAPPPPPA